MTSRKEEVFARCSKCKSIKPLWHEPKARCQDRFCESKRWEWIMFSKSGKTKYVVPKKRVSLGTVNGKMIYYTKIYEN